MTDKPANDAVPVTLLRQMAHDMRGPISVLTNSSDMLLRGMYGELNPKQQRACERLQRSSNRLIMLLDDLMLYIKVEAGQLEPNRQPCGVRGMLAHLIETVQPHAAAKNLALEHAVADSVPTIVACDEILLRRGVLALLWNAVGFTASGRVSLKAEGDASQLVLTVADSGPGIPAANMEHIFEPFWRNGESTQVPTSGFGLGLAMASAVAKLHGGSLALADSGPNGSTFVIRLPVSTVES